MSNHLPDQNIKATNPIKYERLVQLQRVLSSVKEDHFNLKDWLVTYDVVDSVTVCLNDNLPPNQIPSFCGTTACAVGHAFLDPWFIAQGAAVDLIDSLDNGTIVASLYPHILYKNSATETTHLGWSAVEQFFMMNQYEAEYLFSIDTYLTREQFEHYAGQVTPRDVQERIKQKYGIPY